MEDMVCPNCGRRATELHHMVFRSQVKALQNCKLNFIYLCSECHRGTNGVHGKNGHKLDQKLKLLFQNKLEILFLKNELTRKEIKEVLGIKDKPLDNLLKQLTSHNDKYVRKDVIRACMGGRMIIEGE